MNVSLSHSWQAYEEAAHHSFQHQDLDQARQVIMYFRTSTSWVLGVATLLRLTFASAAEDITVEALQVNSPEKM